jgi:hypothetical protein
MFSDERSFAEQRRTASITCAKTSTLATCGSSGSCGLPDSLTRSSLNAGVPPTSLERAHRGASRGPPGRGRRRIADPATCPSCVDRQPPRGRRGRDPRRVSEDETSHLEALEACAELIARAERR